MRLSDLLLYKFVLKVLLPVIIIVYLKVTDLCIAWIYIFKNKIIVGTPSKQGVFC